MTKARVNADNASADIQGVTAGTGLTGGGTSGTVTLTNDMATAIDAKGDLVVGTGADTYSRLATGNNGDTLVADSSASTGLRWTATPSASNPVLNSAFQVWQRGTSILAVASTTAYQADRWQGYSASGNVTVSRQTTNDTTNLPFIQYCARAQRTAGNTATGAFAISQSFESVNAIPFAGKTVTLSFYARAGANYSASSNVLNAGLLTGTGIDQNLQNGYTGAATPINQNATLTTTWQRFSYSATLASNVTELAVSFSFTPTGTAGAADFFEITGVQLDVGSVALPYRSYGSNYFAELAACQRYYAKSYGQSVEPGTATNSGAISIIGPVAGTGAMLVPVRWPVVMRTSPTITVYDSAGTSGVVYKGANGKTALVQNTADSGTRIGTSDATSSSELTFHYTASAEL